jgi:hypothetical protein
MKKKKPLFKTYEASFEKSDAKLVKSFIQQILKQLPDDQRYFQERRAFESAREKVEADPENVKLTKDEYTRLKRNLTENTRALEKQTASSGFLKKWLLKSMTKQYRSLLENHFAD